MQQGDGLNILKDEIKDVSHQNIVYKADVVMVNELLKRANINNNDKDRVREDVNEHETGCC